MGKIINRQSLAASVQRTQSTLAGHSGVPRGMNVARMNANRGIRIATQHSTNAGSIRTLCAPRCGAILATLAPNELDLASN